MDNNQPLLQNDNSTNNIDIRILDAQENSLAKNAASRIQFHPFTYFYYLAEGYGKLSIESEVIDFNAGDLVIINPNIGHTLYVDKSISSCKLIGFGIESISIAGLKNDESMDINYFHVDNKNKSLQFEGLFSDIIREYKGSDLFARSMASSLACALVINLLRKYRKKIVVKHDKRVNRQIDYIKSYMDANYHEDIKLEDLSAMAYMNKFHLISEFKQSYRITPIEYLILKRIEVSKNILISTNHTMEEVSAIVGFNSQSYFNQVFKKKVGETPSQFRKKHRL
ncbi:AraC family transcriptional regulator [Anaerococcus sp. NML200574]|uniref:AraC family transcriptional regulator n=1 Tax=unclassified Anaerococcus TaxID=2614126 RepID=UPI000D0AD7A1|nr:MULTISPECIES: AraC family transcriptional regulator [unclassified Anaerococcus]MCW6677906.1 AraC family transcriptional regulator [Anaerococcus sp. NML200574]MCW6702336.1 AraC family transcriptional regulator [Anaerococcus sp. NML200537]